MRAAMKLVRQPTGSNLCGQACVATILGQSLESAIVLVGKRGKTPTRDLVFPLSVLGYRVDRARRFRPHLIQDLPKLCFLIAHFGHNGVPHRMVWHNGWILDPANGKFRYQTWLRRHGHYTITSYWRIVKRGHKKKEAIP